MRWDDHIYFHCALEGRKLDAMEWSPRVCMTFVGDAQVPQGRFTTYYESAVAFGRAGEVTEEGRWWEACAACASSTARRIWSFQAGGPAQPAWTGIWKISLDEVAGRAISRRGGETGGTRRPWNKRSTFLKIP